MSVFDAYEKMLKDGTASRPIKIAQPTPDNPDGGMLGGYVDPEKSALGEVKENTDGWGVFDSKMKEYIDTKKSKKKTINKTDISEVEKLKKRIDLLEGVVEKIMKAQMDFLKNG